MEEVTRNIEIKLLNKIIIALKDAGERLNWKGCNHIDDCIKEIRVQTKESL